VLGVFPAFRIVGGTLGPLGLLPDADVLWILSIVSIFGTFVWCFLLGLVLLRRSFESAMKSAVGRRPPTPKRDGSGKVRMPRVVDIDLARVALPSERSWRSVAR
jgi:hypothetical protein